MFNTHGPTTVLKYTFISETLLVLVIARQFGSLGTDGKYVQKQI